MQQQLRIASDARSATKKQVAELEEAIDKLKNQTTSAVTELKNLVDGERQKVTVLLAEQQKVFGDAQEARNNSFTDTLRKTQESLTKTLSDQQGQFSAAQENRSREFTTAQAESHKRFGDLIADYTKRLADQDAEFKKQRDTAIQAGQAALVELQTKYEEEATKILKKVNDRREEVEKLVGVIGTLGVTSGYQTTANTARKTMWLWQGVTVTALIAVIWFAYDAFLPAMQGDFKVSGFVARVFLTVTVGVLAAYAGSQADRFFHMEKLNRKLALELAAIDPFIALLPIEEQQKFKLEVGRRTFAQDDAKPDAVEPERSPATALHLLADSDQARDLLKLFQTLAERIPKT